MGRACPSWDPLTGPLAAPSGPLRLTHCHTRGDRARWAPGPDVKVCEASIFRTVTVSALHPSVGLVTRTWELRAWPWDGLLANPQPPELVQWTGPWANEDTPSAGRARRPSPSSCCTEVPTPRCTSAMRGGARSFTSDPLRAWPHLCHTATRCREGAGSPRPGVDRKAPPCPSAGQGVAGAQSALILSPGFQ